MSKKILFSDLDGTLYINGVVSADDREAIRRWRAAGNLFAMASGRYLGALTQHLAEQGVEWDYLLCLNGAEAYDRDCRRLFEVPIDIALLPGLYHTIVQNDGWANVCYGDRGERIRTEPCSDFNSDHAHFFEDRLSTFSRFTQICSAARDKDIAGAFEIKKRVLDRFGNSVNAEVNGWSIDINEKSVSKASGIAKIIQIVDIDSANVYTVGDNFNDLSMLTAYCGYAMAHAPEEVQIRTGRTVRSVADLINHLLDSPPDCQHYDKLVRDRIPEIIEAEGFTPKVRVLDSAEYLAELHRKLREETDEYIRDQSAEEIADVLEVLEAICAARGFSKEEILRIKTSKRKNRGGFEKKLYLISKS